MLEYKKVLKSFSRELRDNMTHAEILLWARLRHKQILGVQFYRQKPLLGYIVDFYSPKAKLVIECDGSQHFEAEHIILDKDRDDNLAQYGIRVLRFDNLQIIQQMDSVMECIWGAVHSKLE